jgi:hypothetical protein
MVGGGSCLPRASGRQSETREIGVDEMVGVRHLAVADEEGGAIRHQPIVSQV